MAELVERYRMDASHLLLAEADIQHLPLSTLRTLAGAQPLDEVIQRLTQGELFYCQPHPQRPYYLYVKGKYYLNPAAQHVASPDAITQLRLRYGYLSIDDKEPPAEVRHGALIRQYYSSTRVIEPPSPLPEYTPIETPSPPKGESIPLSLHYNDEEATPAGKVPYEITLACGAMRRGTLDDKGQATEHHCTSGIKFIEYYPDVPDSHLRYDQDRLHGLLDKALDQCAADLANADITVARTLSEPVENDPAFEVYHTVKAASEEKIHQLKALSDIHQAKPLYRQLLANASAARDGISDGVTHYLPDLGELGDVLSEVGIDPLVLMDILTTGDIDALEKHFQQWPHRGKAGYEAASESMEALILILSDTRTRELLISLPARYLAVMPEPELVKIAASQGTQTTLDVGATTVGTAAAGPVGTALIASLALLRKGGKAVEGLIKLLNELVTVLKKKRNKHNDKDQQHSQTPLGSGDKKDHDGSVAKGSEDNPNATQTASSNATPPPKTPNSSTVPSQVEVTPPVITGGKSSTLKANLAEDLSLPRSTSFPQHQAHHLIPSAVGKRHPVFKKIGIDLDQSANGILLPAKKGTNVSALPAHVGSHQRFNRFVNEKLDALDVNAPPEVLRGKVQQLQQGLRKLLEGGIPITGKKNSLGNNPRASVETLHKHFDRINSQ